MNNFFYFLGGMALFIPASIHAEEFSYPCYPQTYSRPHFAGLHAGGFLGYGYGKAVVNQEPPKKSGDIALSGGNIGFFLGYNKPLGFTKSARKIYVGLSLNYTVDFAKGTATVINEVEVRKRNAFDLVASLGLVHNNIMPFIKLGLSTAQIDGSNKTNNNASFLKKNVAGLIWGMGSDLQLNRMIYGIDYTFIAYQKKKNEAAAGGPTTTKVMDNKLRFKIGYQL